MWTKYNSACYLINDKVMIDFPNGACKYLFRQDISPVNIHDILITHFHGDHYFDLPFYILYRSKNKCQKTTIHCSIEGKEKIEAIGHLAFPNSFDDATKDSNLNYNFNSEINIDNIQIKRILVDHGRMKPAYGYILKDKDNYIGFTGDTALCENVEYMSSICKNLFCDCMLEKGSQKHQGIDNITYLANKYPNCTFIVSHLNNPTRNILENMQIKNVIVPNDGQIINI